MADLLASLEIGITRTVGAASRLRNQISNIDEYMAAQRQQDFAAVNPSAAYPTPNPSSGHFPNQSFTKQEMPNPNIDPELQNAVSTTSTTGYQQPNPNPYDYTNPANGVNGLGGPVDEQFQFQLPPELLEGWPWPLDMSQGLGGF
jgi:hypothetical protein